jgi:hypothetical protein
VGRLLKQPTHARLTIADCLLLTADFSPCWRSPESSTPLLVCSMAKVWQRTGNSKVRNAQPEPQESFKLA